MLITSLCDNNSLTQIQFHSKLENKNFYFTKLKVLEQITFKQSSFPENLKNGGFQEFCFISLNDGEDLKDTLKKLNGYGNQFVDFGEKLQYRILSTEDDETFLKLIREYQKFLSENRISFYPNYITWMRQISSNSTEYFYYLGENGF